jgi:hypothetical protein
MGISLFADKAGTLIDTPATITGVLLEGSAEATLTAGDILHVGFGTTGVAAVAAASPAIYFKEVA